MTDPCIECTSHKEHESRIKRLEDHEDQRSKDIRNTYMLVVAAIIAMVFNILTTVITPQFKGAQNDTDFRPRQSKRDFRHRADDSGNRSNSDAVSDD